APSPEGQAGGIVPPRDRLSASTRERSPSMTVASPPPPPGAPAPKKGMGPLGWIAIGCGVIALIGILALAAGGWFVKRQVDKYKDNPTIAAAELIVRANPDLEVVSSDPKGGTLTIKNSKTGETVT